MDPGISQAIQIAGNLVPALVSTVKALIDAGHSPEEAEAIVKKDIESRRVQYAAEKQKDLDALKDKHGR